MRLFYIGFALYLPLLALGATTAEEVKLQLGGEIISGPKAPANRDAWFKKMKSWRDDARNRIKYDDAQYRCPELQWAQRAFVQPQAMVEDRYFYDVTTGKYTVDRYLDDVNKRYGGIDAVLLWPVYPNIGIDDRNQHDMHCDLPGGIAGVRKMIDEFHQRGVKVLFPAMPCDTGTRPAGKPLAEATLDVIKQFGADGINGDTMLGIEHDFLDASNNVQHPVALQPEVGFRELDMIKWNTMSWGYWQYLDQVSVVSKYKWLESRHMVNISERWARDRTNGLQSAFFNGVGYESWENVWGIWNQFTPRDAEALRRIATIERATADLLVSPKWEPHVPTLRNDIYSSRFPGKDRTLWLFVNRTDKAISGDQIEVPAKGMYYDLWHGKALSPTRSNENQRLAVEIEAHGYGAILAIHENEVDEKVAKLMLTMKELSKQRLADFSSKWKPLPQKMVEIPKTKPAAAAPKDMVLIPAVKYWFKVSGIEVEGFDEPGVDVQYPWEDIPRRHHDKQFEIATFYIDKYPVTNEQFKKFLDATNYRPKDDHNFLRDWKDGTYPAGWEKKPVTWVSLEDAREYAAWAGKRLPHEWEWQYAAQSNDGRAYPWGNGPNSSAVPPFEETTRVMSPPANVNAHPKGASPFGVMDMVGNIWHWTDEFQDEHTRAAIVRGGGHYRPIASKWYFPTTISLEQHGKYLLMAPSRDRSGAIGFRCVVDK